MATATWLLGLDALAVVLVYLAARMTGAPRAGAVVLRVLAALGLLIPGWTILRWYDEVSKAREFARDLPLRTEPIVEQFATRSVGLLSVGFVILIGGVFLARLVSRPGTNSSQGDIR